MSIEDRNYYSDYRVRAKERRYDSPIVDVDPGKMKATVRIYDEEYAVPIHFEVCLTCEGKGTHVNPPIDCGGLSGEDLYEEPDFTEDYLGGAYDVTCYECKGERVVPVIDFDSIPRELAAKIEDKAWADIQHRAEVNAERRMGA